MDNLEELRKIRLPGDRTLEFILAVPARRYAEFAPIIEPLGAGAKGDWVREASWQAGPDQPALRLVVSHDEAAACEMTAQRRARIQALEEEAQRWASKLDAQDEGSRARGRKLSDSGAKARFFHAVADAHLSSIVQVDLKSDLFTWDVNEAVLKRHETLDGKLVLLTNVTDLAGTEIVDRYKSLADIERGFRVLKSEIEIGPVFHQIGRAHV